MSDELTVKRMHGCPAALVAAYEQALVNGSQAFRTASGEVKQITKNPKPIDPRTRPLCQYCGRYLEATRSWSPHKKKFCDRLCSSNYRQKRKAAAAKQQAKARS
jgi:hypothetical protein